MKIELYSHLRGVMFGFQIFNSEPFEFERLKFKRSVSIQIYIGFLLIIISTKNFNIGFLDE